MFHQQGSTVNQANGLWGTIPLKYTNISGNGLGYATVVVVVVFGYPKVFLSVCRSHQRATWPSDAYTYAIRDVSRQVISPFSNLTKDGHHVTLLDEGGRELYVEGVRRQDLVRNGTFISNAIVQGKANAQPTMTLFPIPNAVVVASRGVFAQNPGY